MKTFNEDIKEVLRKSNGSHIPTVANIGALQGTVPMIDEFMNKGPAFDAGVKAKLNIENRDG